MTFTIKVEKEISAQEVADLIITALEGGVNYWCGGVETIPHNDIKTPEAWTDPNFTLKVTDAEEEEPDAQVHVNKARVEAALLQFHERSPGVELEACDADDADVFFQYLVFGEIVYG